MMKISEMMSSNSCFLCGELPHHGGRIAIIDNLQIVSDIAPLNPGHILLGSTKHVFSLSMLTLDDLDRVEYLKEILRKILTKVYCQEPVLFEHGMGDACELPACGIDHCHLHLIPVPGHDEFFGQTFFDFLHNLHIEVESVDLQSYRDLKCVEGKNYLFIEDLNGVKQALGTSHNFPAQVLRKYVATRLGSPYTYDWQLFFNQKKAQDTTRFLRNELQTTLKLSSFM